MSNKIRPALLLAAAALCFRPAPASVFDALILLEQTAQAGQGGTVTLGGVDLINDLSPAAQPAPALTRDSLHFGLGLPAGWTVTAVSIYPAFDFRPSKASVNHLDTNYRNQLLLDSLEAYAGKGTALSADPGLADYVKGRTYRVKASPESLGALAVIKADTLSQWLGFAGALNLSIPAGQPADTVQGGNAVKQIPVFIYVTLKAGNKDESVKPICLVKTGPLDTAAPVLDRGSTAYRPVTVGTPVAILGVSRGSWRLEPSAAPRDLLGRRASYRAARARILYLIH